MVAARVARAGLSLPRHWWRRQSLRAHITIVATALFSFAVITGAVLLLVLQRSALTRVLDQQAAKTATSIRAQIARGISGPLELNTGGVTGAQVVNRDGVVEAASPGSKAVIPQLDRDQLSEVRNGARIEITSVTSGAPLRVFARDDGKLTILVFTDVSRVDDSLRILSRAALIGSPLAVLVMAAATYFVVGLTLRPVAALRHGAADISAAGLAEQRLPVPGARDEIRRLAVTLNAMLDRIDSATKRQRTFVGDAAHELRSPLASLRVQLEVAQRLGPEADWTALIDDVMLDVTRLDRLVRDLLSLARLDEAGRLNHRRPIALDDLVPAVVARYEHARVPVHAAVAPAGTSGDPDALRRVVINLIDNAVRHANSEVRVGVSTEAGTGHGVLEVIDDGPGIPEVERERVFDRFYRVQQSRSRDTGGTGLGLPIVRDVVRTHGGRVRLEARADGRPGLRAVVWFPPPPD